MVGRANRRGRGAHVAGMGLALMAALGLALVGCGSGASGGAGDVTLYPTIPAPTVTASPRPTATPSGAAWTRVSASSGATATMPASLRVSYQVSWGQSSKTTAPQFSLRRTDDFGQSWVNLSPPFIAGVNYATDTSYAAITLSPFSPQVAILTLQFGSRCPLSLPSAMPEVCQAQFETSDGGAAWTLLRLPAPGTLGLTSMFDGASRDNLTAQGARIYGVVNEALFASGGGNTPPGRLVVSDDGGATWRLDDSALATRNLLIYAYSAPASGSTIYALAGATNANLTPGALPPLSLWRSDDAGASWTQAGPLPAATFGQMLAASDAATGQRSLYVIVSATPGSAPRLYASHDGAHTWTQCGLAPTNAGELLAALPNGSVLLDTASGVEEWDGSASAPRAAAQPTGLNDGPQTTLQPQPDGSTRVWLSGGDAQGAVVEYTTLRL